MAEPSLKILIIGPSNVGKSALLKRYCDDDFDPNDASATIGIDLRVKRLSVHGTTYRVTLLDTAGQERFRTLSSSYYRGAHGVIFVYDVTNRSTFSQMDTWRAEADANTALSSTSTAPALPCQYCLIGTKLDRAAAGRAVTRAEGAALARRMGRQSGDRGGKPHGDDDGDDDEGNNNDGALFFETSARTGECVREPFMALVDRIVTAAAAARGGNAWTAVAGSGTTAGIVSLNGNSMLSLSGCSC